jgi:hypothetical protein
MLKRIPLALLACAAAVSSGLFAADNQLSTQEKKDGWQLLFDGRTFADWDDITRKSPPGDSFTIQDGCLKATAHPKITEDLFSKDTFASFDLEWDWKISPHGNSGLKYKIQDHVFTDGQPAQKFADRVNAALRNRLAARAAAGSDYVIGFEYQMSDDTPGSPMDKDGPLHQTAAFYDIVPPANAVSRPVGEFNHSRIVVKGKHVEHWLNGRKVVDSSLDAPEVARSMAARWGAGTLTYDLLVKQPRNSCPISLQNHGDEAWFKNIKIKRLD